MARALATIKQGVEEINSIDALQLRYQAELLNLGFDRYTYVHTLAHALEESSPEYFGEALVLGSTFPDEFREIYRRNAFHRTDPIIKACRHSMAPVMWDEIAEQDDLDADGKELFRYAGEHGINQGISIPIHGPNGSLGIVSLASDKPAHEFRQMVAAHQSDIHYMTAVFHERVHQLAPARHEHGENYALSPRELECLRWTANGKTAWEVAQICDISQNTVNFHLKNSMAKLDVHSKTHAVAKAMALGLTSI